MEYFNAVKRRKAVNIEPLYCLGSAKKCLKTISKRAKNEAQICANGEQLAANLQQVISNANFLAKNPSQTQLANLTENSGLNGENFNDSDVQNCMQNVADCLQNVSKVKQSKVNQSKLKICAGERACDDKNDFNNLDADKAYNSILQKREQQVKASANSQYSNNNYGYYAKKNNYEMQRHYTKEELKSFFTNINEIKL